MSSKDDFDDDYVARLLAEDAKKTSAKYASQGLSAFLPKKRATDTPKPNTRFLSHIVREADSHNAALKRKEEVEAERRLRALREADERPAKRRRADESDVSKRSRMFKDILGAARSEKPSRGSDDRRRHESKDSAKHKTPGRHRSRSPGQRKRHLRRRSRSMESDREDGKSRRHRSRPDKTTTPTREPRLSNDSHDEVKVRGRGAHKHRSAMDDHFKEGYDPSQDVSLDSDHHSDAEDWDLALEAMRDRAKYKQSQAGRMRDAGFSEDDIAKWEKGLLNPRREDGDVTSVKWSRKGEVREWDAGK